MTDRPAKKRPADTLDTIRHAIKVTHDAGLRVHHVEIGAVLWQRLRPSLSACELRDDVGYGTRPGGPQAPVVDGVVLVPGALTCMDEWALVFGMMGDSATDHALTPEHRKLYEEHFPAVGGFVVKYRVRLDEERVTPAYADKHEAELHAEDIRSYEGVQYATVVPAEERSSPRGGRTP